MHAHESRGTCWGTFHGTRRLLAVLGLYDGMERSFAYCYFHYFVDLPVSKPAVK